MTYIINFIVLKFIVNTFVQKDTADMLLEGENPVQKKMSASPAEVYVWRQYEPTHMHRRTHTWVLQWWWRPERLISHHGGKLKGWQHSLSPSSVSCCLQASTPCCVFLIPDSRKKKQLKSKLRSWIKNNGLAHYGKRSKLDRRQERKKEGEIGPWYVNTSIQRGMCLQRVGRPDVAYTRTGWHILYYFTGYYKVIIHLTAPNPSISVYQRKISHKSLGLFFLSTKVNQTLGAASKKQAIFIRKKSSSSQVGMFFS